jgi:DNA-binding transcriptional ArsR family regulator
VAPSTLRIHFALEDLARTRIAAGPDVLWEIANSLSRLQSRRPGVVFGRWRNETVRRLGRWVELLQLVPPPEYFADFITPANADGEVMIRLRQALQQYYEAAVEPYWSTITKHVEADRALRIKAFLDGGCEGLLGSLRPGMRWRPPALEMDYPVEQDLHLAGRGLLLVPSFFCWRTLVTLPDGDQQPVLVYPIDKGTVFPAAAPEPSGGDAARRLGALLGNTRAAVLRAVGTPCTTTELGRRAGVSIASASQHATVLREAGLISTQREGSSVRHSLTALGAALLGGAGA